MNTPICDFVKSYAKQNTVRAHMPGHKGWGRAEKYDITEIKGADVLYEENGIIEASQKNASELFGTAATIYSCEGSTLVIKAMLGVIAEGVNGRKPRILAARNVHKAFIYACALLDIEADFLYGKSDNVCECEIKPADLKKALTGGSDMPDAVYVTSPDYLGNIADIKGLAEVCGKYNIPLLVDNAHGAYLKFTQTNRHPISLGAAMCADSAHKTLPVLTGGAYLHIGKKYSRFIETAKRKMQLFASTSPSYLILASLDKCNRYLSSHSIVKTEQNVLWLKKSITGKGFNLVGEEPLKITVDCYAAGYSGYEFAEILRNKKIECEYADNRYLVLMLSGMNKGRDLERIKKAFFKTEIKQPLSENGPVIEKGEAVTSVRNAVLGKRETVKVEDALGRICAVPTVSCPPAIPIIISGEIITESAIEILKQYKIEKIDVLKDA